jgi:hypothetical protein
VNITSPELLEVAEKAEAEYDVRLRVISTTNFLNFGGSGAAYFPQALPSPIRESQYERKTLKQIVKNAVHSVQLS